MAACSNRFFYQNLAVGWDEPKNCFAFLAEGKGKTIPEINAIMESCLAKPPAQEEVFSRRLTFLAYLDLKNDHAKKEHADNFWESGCMRAMFLLVKRVECALLKMDYLSMNVMRPLPSIGAKADEVSQAIREKQSDSVKALLSEGGNANGSDWSGCPHLCMAAALGDAASVDALYREGAEVNAMMPSGVTALHLAVLENHVGVVCYLLDRGANFEIRDKHQRTPLYWAKLLGHSELVEVILGVAEQSVTEEEVESEEFYQYL